MNPSSVDLTVFRERLEQVGPFVRQLLEQAVDQWVLSLIWAGLFCVTFLLMRMLITRWGDTRVTMKAVVLSLLVHLVAGLWTTTFKIASETLTAEKQALVPVRRLVVEGDQPVEKKKSGNTPVWEKTPPSKPEDLTRIERTPLAAAPLETPKKALAPLATPPVQIPNLPKLPDLIASLPETIRSAERAAKVVEGTRTPINEQTAEARPDVQVPAAAPARQPRAPAGVTQAEAERPTRPGVTEDLSVNLKPAKEIASRPAAADPAATIQRGPEADRPQRRASPTPAAVPTDDPGVASRTTPTETGKGVPQTTPFARIGRPTRTPNEAAGAERLNPSSKPQTIDPDPGRMFDSRIGARELPSTSLTPNLVRPELESPADRNATRVPATYRLRNLPQRKRVALEMGATENSERAVELSLQWLARHQNIEGFWDADGFSAHCPAGDRCLGLASLGRDPVDPTQPALNTPERQRSGMQADSGLTGLAILAFLGAGYTHEEGTYADQLDRALRWLIRQQRLDGYLGGKAGRYASMYCHGMAAIALGEAYGMTHDPTLRDPLVLAVQHIVHMQNAADGGWRYERGQREGDVSMFGWQLMALKSAGTAGLEIPADTWDKAIDFLKQAGQGKHGGLAAYRKAERVKPSMTAEALFSRQILGMKRTNPASVEAVEYLSQHLPRRAEYDLYYWYYGTLAMYQYGGQPWRAWNDSLRDTLVAEQRTTGHAAGSWDPRTPWGDYGGRIFSTAVSTLCLEVYYRFLPLHQMGGQYEEGEK